MKTKIELIAEINKLRKDNKNKWVNTHLDYNQQSIGVKFYDTWMQILIIGGVTHSSNMGISVKQFNEFLNEAIK